MRMTTSDLGMVMPLRSIQSSYMSSSPSHSTGKKEEVVKDQFPAGLRVLVVDDDHMTLLILEKMLRSCSYTVTTCGKARAALALLRENKNDFDLVLSDVYMPDMDGFKLLELVGLEMDLPVIMMSSDGDPSNVMKGITHGACDYLLKPVRMEELRNIWQHVVRKKKNEAKEVDHVSSQEACNEKQKRGGEDGEPTSSTNSKKRKDVKEEEEDLDHDNDDPSSLKKPRVVWSVELHQKFVSAVNQLGIDKAVPKKILELMGLAGLTRENVASHLQKYRLYLKRISVQQQQNGMNLSFGGPTECGSEVRPLPGNSSFPMQHLGTVQQGVLGRLGNTNSLTSNSLDPSLLQFVGIQGGPLFSPRLPSPVFSSQTNYLPAFTGGYQLEHTQQLSPFGAVAPTVDDVTGLNTVQHQVPNTGKHSSMSNLGGLTGTFCTSQGSNSLMVQLLQQRQQPYAHQGVNMAMGGGLGQHRNEIVNLGINTGLVDDTGYAALGGINTPAGGGGNPALLENKSGMLGVVDSNFPPASLNASAVPLATPVPPFDADDGGKISTLDSTAMQGLGQSLNAVANLNAGFGMTYNQNRIPGWQSQELGQISSPVVTPRYSQSVASQNFTVQSQVNAHEHKKMELGRPGLRDSNSEQSTADSSFKPKAISGSLISAKLGLQIDQAPASDDLLSFYLKQEQQELSFPENDLAFDGYIPDNLYVK